MREKAWLNDTGVTLFEALVTLGIIGLIASISVPALGTQVQEYRLSTSAREVMGNIALAKMKAVSSNYKVTFTYNIGSGTTLPPRDSYQVTGSEDVNGNGSLEVWEDTNGNLATVTTPEGLRDTNNDGILESAILYDTAPEIFNVQFDTTGLTTLPNGENPASAPTTKITMVFKPNGSLHLASAPPAERFQTIVFRSTQGNFYAVCVDTSGFIRLYTKKSTQTAWTEIN